MEIRLNTKADRAFIEAAGADAVVAATGSKPIVPDFGGKNHIFTATDVLSGKYKAGDNIVVIGGGLVGCETALWLAQQGKKVSVVEMMPDILGGPHSMPFMNYDMLKDLLPYNKVDVYRKTKVTKVGDCSVTVENENGEKEISADTVLVAVGYRSEKNLQEDLSGLNIPVYNIGDSREVKNIIHAIWDAYEVARNI